MPTLTIVVTEGGAAELAFVLAITAAAVVFVGREVVRAVPPPVLAGLLLIGCGLTQFYCAVGRPSPPSRDDWRSINETPDERARYHCYYETRAAAWDAGPGRVPPWSWPAGVVLVALGVVVALGWDDKPAGPLPHKTV